MNRTNLQNVWDHVDVVLTNSDGAWCVKPFHIGPHGGTVVRILWPPVMQTIGQGGSMSETMGDAESATTFELR